MKPKLHTWYIPCNQWVFREEDESTHYFLIDKEGTFTCRVFTIGVFSNIAFSKIVRGGCDTYLKGVFWGKNIIEVMDKKLLCQLNNIYSQKIYKFDNKDRILFEEKQKVLDKFIQSYGDKKC